MVIPIEFNPRSPIKSLGRKWRSHALAYSIVATIMTRWWIHPSIRQEQERKKKRIRCNWQKRTHMQVNWCLSWWQTLQESYLSYITNMPATLWSMGSMIYSILSLRSYWPLKRLAHLALIKSRIDDIITSLNLKDRLNQKSSCSRKAWSCSIFDGLKFPSWKMFIRLTDYKTIKA